MTDITSREKSSVSREGDFDRCIQWPPFIPNYLRYKRKSAETGEDFFKLKKSLITENWICPATVSGPDIVQICDICCRQMCRKTSLLIYSQSSSPFLIIHFTYMYSTVCINNIGRILPLADMESFSFFGFFFSFIPPSFCSILNLSVCLSVCEGLSNM